MYRLAYRQNKLLFNCQRIYARPRFKNGNTLLYKHLGRDSIVVISRYYASSSGSPITRTAKRAGKWLIWRVGFLVVTGGIFIMVRCALIRIIYQFSVNELQGNLKHFILIFCMLYIKHCIISLKMLNKIF